MTSFGSFQKKLGDTYPEGLWSAWDDMAVEQEVAELLYGIVRVTKPGLVLESGTGRGVGSLYIAAALKDNQAGRLYTFEPVERFAAEARHRLARYPATVLAGSTLDYCQGDMPDLVFLDSGPDTRPQEIALWLGRDTALAVHDARRYDLPGGVMFPTDRGLWLRL